MINLNYLYQSVLFYLICKIISSVNYYLLSRPMYTKSKPTLTSIPENNESDVDITTTRWVPKKKHEVLKAKYKCLKKLFQIYDASVIGILPETCGNGDGFSVEERDVDTRKSRRKKRSHRTKTDACAGTTDVSSELTEHDTKDTATAVMRELNMDCSNMYSATDFNSKSKTTISRFRPAPSKEYLSNSSVRECGCTQTNDAAFQHPIPYLMMSEKRKPTRFQIFVQRLLGIRRERPYKGYVLNGHVLAASDNNINQRYVEKRKRRGLRFRRLRRPKKIQSDGALRDAAPALLSCAQAVQRNCLLDTTPRQCPIAGCRMIFYGIINYNDHLNMCHFTERRYTCHYCHEGFERESEKLRHENEHIGLSRMSPLILPPAQITPRCKMAITSNTQTDPELTKDVQDEKLKKIVSFFDKIADSDQILSEIKKNRYSESNLRTCDASENSQSETTSSKSETKRMSSCVDVCKRMSSSSDMKRKNLSGTKIPFQYGGVKCNFCGEKFEYRRQLSLHVDLEHRLHDKFSKFHSCAGITGLGPRLLAEDGTIQVTSVDTSLKDGQSLSTLTQHTASVYSLESSKRSSVMTMVDKFKNGLNSYKWEPGTKIIRV